MLAIKRPHIRACPPLLGLAFVTLIGCTTLPDVGPFAEATAELRSAVVGSGTTAESELRRMQGGQSYAEQFADQWKTRTQAMNGLVDYADSLQSIVKASSDAESNVGALADNVAQLATAAGIALPGAGAVAVASDMASFVYGQIALARAAQSLEGALEASQPAIEQIANIIALDLKDTQDIFRVASADIVQSVQIEHQVQLGFRKQLVSERQGLYAKGPQNLSDDEKKQLHEFDEMIKATDEWYLPLQNEQEAITARLQAGEAVFAAAAEGVSQWAVAHKKLVIAIKERRPASVRSLAEATADIRSLVRRTREL